MAVEIPWVFYACILLTVVYILSNFSKRSLFSNLPPGPPKLPLIGNLHQLASKNTLPHRRLADLAAVYGPIMHLQLGEVPTVIVSSADVAREVMKTHDAATCSRPTMMVGKELFYNCTDIGLAPYGEYWRQVRKISTLELFTTKRVESFRPIREEEVTNLIQSIASQAGSVVNLSRMLFGLTFDITSRVAFKIKGKQQEAFRELISAALDVSSGFSIIDIYPSLEWLHSMSGMKKKLREFVKESNKILEPIFEEHKYKKTVQGKEEDLMDVLFKFHKDNVKDSDFSLTTENIKAIILEIFGAGSETSSSVVEWAMSELLKNPRVMKKAQEEVRQVYGTTSNVVDETKLNDLKYLKLVIKETFRLHPPTPLLIPRESIEKCQIHGYNIPPQTRVIINAWAITRDPKYWTEPERFYPERFENSLVDYKGNHFEFIPFGAGRRKCPGMSLGVANVELPLAMLLYHFDWTLPNTVKTPQDLDMEESFGISMRRKNELIVTPFIHQTFE